MRGIRRKRIGANDLAYSAGDSKFADIKASVQEHGYRVKVSITLNYNAMTDRQAQASHKLAFDLMSQALSAAQEKRATNIPLFDVSELNVKPDKGQGVNTR